MVSEGRKGAVAEEPKPAEEATSAAASTRAPMFSAAGYLVLLVIVLLEGVLIYSIVKFTAPTSQADPGKKGPDVFDESDVYLDIDEVTAPLHGTPPGIEKSLRIRVAVAVDKEEREKVETMIKEKKPALIQLIRRAMTDVVSFSDVTGDNVSEAEDRLQRRIFEELDRPMGHKVKRVAISDFNYF